jgi:hypothetical protein
VILGHGIGGIRDLPVPNWLFFYGAGIVLGVSFIGLALLWRRPLLDRLRTGHPVKEDLERFLDSRALRIVLGALSVFLLAVVWLAAAIGENSAATNLAPTFVYVVFWLGLVPLSVLFGNVYSVLNPWKAAADGVAWAAERAGLHYTPPVRYPDRLGRWPAAVLLLAFVTLELCYSNPSDPRALALAIFFYSWISWCGMAAIGRRPWVENCDAFANYFGMLARVAPVARENGRLVFRWPCSGLSLEPRRPGTIALLAVMLGSVAFDGFSRTQIWQDRYYQVQVDLLDNPSLADLVGILMSLGGLLATIVAVGLLFEAAVWGARWIGRSHSRLGNAFVLSLVPIALVYAVAHYFSLFILQGQVAVKLASDPFGWGWNVLGTSGVKPDFTILAPNTIWYVQVGALVAGHIAGLAVAHDRAVERFHPARVAIASQYPMLGLMIAYTVGGLWLLSQN